MNNATLLWGGVLVAVIIALGGYAYPTIQQAAVANFGAITNYDSIGTAALAVGSGCDNSMSTCTGTTVNADVFGSCTIWAGSQTIGATSTAQVVCQSATDGTLTSGLTNVTSDSYCTVTQASSTNTLSGGIAVGGVSASSTAGSIVVQIRNLTGATFTWNAAATSSSQWKYECKDPA